MKTIRVAAAVIQKDDKFFIAQRGYGEFKDKWEFPGGKLEEGETSEKALLREMEEELKAKIQIEKYLLTVNYDYPQFHLVMDVFLCSFVNPHFVLVEAESYQFVTKSELKAIDFLPADKIVCETLLDL